MIRIFAMAAVFAASTLTAGASTVYGRISGVVQPTIDSFGNDGAGLFGAVGGNLAYHAFQLDFTFPSTGIATLSSGAQTASTLSVKLRINGQVFAFGGAGLLGLVPDTLDDPGHYTLTDSSLGTLGGYTLSAGLSMHTYTDLPDPFDLATPLLQMASGASEDFFDVVLTDAQSHQHGETMLSFDTRRIQISAAPIPVPAAGGLLLAALAGLVGLRRRV